MKTIVLKCLTPAALLVSLAMPLAVHADPGHMHNIHSRFENQHDRIHQGVETGSLTRREQYRLNARDARIRAQEYHDRMSGGRFTPRERRRIQHELNHSSRAIDRQRHDDQNR